MADDALSWLRQLLGGGGNDPRAAAWENEPRTPVKKPSDEWNPDTAPEFLWAYKDKPFEELKYRDQVGPPTYNNIETDPAYAAVYREAPPKLTQIPPSPWSNPTWNKDIGWESGPSNPEVSDAPSRSYATQPEALGGGWIASQARMPTSSADRAVPQGRDDALALLRQRLSSAYPGLAPVLRDADVAYARPPQGGGDRYMEYYPPWEGNSPSPGRTRFELYPKFQGMSALEQLQMLAGDTLHHLGAVDPRTGQAVDPAWQALKQQFAGSMTPQQTAVDRRAYQQEGDQRPFDDWRQQSRIDAYLRGGMFPAANPEWQRPGIFDDQQQELLRKMLRRIAPMEPPT